MVQGAVASVRAEDVEVLIREFAAMTEPGPGVTRLAYSRLEREAHAVFARYMRELGLIVWTDAAGNTIAELAGQDESLPAIGTGSHLDSVPEGGSFDGVAGVVAALEVARLFVHGDVRNVHPMRFVVFAAEEGARFGQACTGSRIVAGLTTSSDVGTLVDNDGVVLADAMADVGIDPRRVEDAVWRRDDWAAFVELHIEQGSVLTEVGARVGIVDVISGSTRLRIDVTGRASHTGGTPMHRRADALAAAAQVILTAEEIANDAEHRGTRITVGRIEVGPGSITTIPGSAHLFVDVRDIDSDRQREAASQLIAAAYGVGEERGVGIQVEMLADASPAVLPLWVRSSIARSASGLGVDYRVMPSGASHDSQMVNHVCPAGMIFVPSQNHGISHAPEEFSRFDDLALGVDVLAASLLDLDARMQAESQ
ncbi:Zn-dependent hydrolase [Cryobacterium tepidiphilum]|uniref:Zn-dependent hydrolase n=1 Tax=Cryobacterium tepidiphilum TaxID=2486026 RepID=A0A3M8KTY6_9MICO|nr:Zn-dependent hydrolase [Cryobacterium tepidiphilum]RNE56525.1 Zn-dependent hydrolase [Cryobacterium tepidiphilum]